MEKATITEVKNHLSAFLDKVKQGEAVLITDRGLPVARIEAVLSNGAESDLNGRLVRLERSGLVRRASSQPPVEEITRKIPPAPREEASLLRAVITEREEGR